MTIIDDALAAPEFDFDEVEAKIAALGEETGDECMIEHSFTPGLYMRKFFMPMGTILTSKIHNSTHPYIVLTGVASVWTKEDGTHQITGPYHGVTTPGTRRIIFAHTDVVWMTFHATEETDIDVIEDQIIQKKQLK